MTIKEKATIMECIAILNAKKEAYAISVILSNNLVGAGYKALSSKLENNVAYRGLCNKWLAAYDMAEMLLGDMSDETLPRYDLTINDLALTSIKYRLYSGIKDCPDIDWYKLWSWAIDYNYKWPDWGKVEEI